MKKFIVSALIITLGFLLKHCNTTEPPPPNGEKPTLELTLEDVSCIEAWIKLTTTNLTLPAALILYQDSVAQNNILCYGDTLLYVDSLLPNKNYQYQVSSIENPATSNELTVTTLDTTSHNFTFETFTFGGTAGSSVLYDVAIINEDNIWAVGEIFVADTSINGYTMYNAVRWDGVDWELKRIPYLFQGDSFYNPIYAVFTFGADDIWFGIGNLIHWDGIKYWSIGISTIFPSLVNKIWGSSSNDLYVVGNNGSIVYYNGQSWHRIESGTLLNINDIWGDFNEKTQEWEILAVAFNYPTGLDREIFRIKNNYVQNISTVPIMWPISTVWFISNRQYYVAGAGVYQKRLIQDGQWKNHVLDITTFTTTSIRGNSTNDVIGVGAFGDFLHFNGIGWKNDYEEPLLSNGSYTEVAVKSNLVVAVGSNQTSLNSEAIVLIGRR